MIKFDKEYLEDRFPHLLDSIENKSKKIEIDGVRTNQKEAKKAAKTDKSVKETVVDYIRLCEDEEEAFNIINFMEEKRGIESNYAEKLRKQLKIQGLRSFGSKRSPGEYPYIDKNEE